MLACLSNFNLQEVQQQNKEFIKKREVNKAIPQRVASQHTYHNRHAETWIDAGAHIGEFGMTLETGVKGNE
jgi:hypothetical protein